MIHICFIVQPYFYSIDDVGQVEDEPEQSRLSSLDVNLELIDKRLVNDAINKLSDLRRAVATLEKFRFYSCSLLLIYEGDVPDVDVEVPDVQSCGDNYNDTKKLFTEPSTQQLESHIFNNKSVLKTTEQVDVLPPVRTTSNYFDKQKGKSSTVSSSAGDLYNDHRLPENKSLTKNSTQTRSFSSTTPIKLTSENDTRSSSSSSVDVRLIDFAHFCYQDPVVHPGPDGGFVFGLDKLICLLQTMIS